jgi:hypothetical protein
MHYSGLFYGKWARNKSVEMAAARVPEQQITPAQAGVILTNGSQFLQSRINGSEPLVGRRDQLKSQAVLNGQAHSACLSVYFDSAFAT